MPPVIPVDPLQFADPSVNPSLSDPLLSADDCDGGLTEEIRDFIEKSLVEEDLPVSELPESVEGDSTQNHPRFGN